MNELVPFGKYKGQPVEQLRNDPEYVEWLLAQPWFAQRFGGIRTLIINNFKEPDETPEHNELQARFLDDDYARRVAFKAFPNRLETARHWEELCIKRMNDNYSVECGFQWKRSNGIYCEFETKEGWDVRIRLEYHLHCYENNGDVYIPGRGEWFQDEVFGELKPTIGDEYPRVLRDCKSRKGAGFVFADRFIAEGASRSQVVKIFASSRIPLVFASDLVEHVA